MMSTDGELLHPDDEDAHAADAKAATVEIEVEELPQLGGAAAAGRCCRSREELPQLGFTGCIGR